MARHKDIDWNLPNERSGHVDGAYAQTAVLMDIRDELQTLNRLLSFTDIPQTLRRIDKRIAKKVPLK